ncbi:6-hydroxy-D-nicotine oxidase [Apiospora arundinis]
MAPPKTPYIDQSKVNLSHQAGTTTPSRDVPKPAAAVSESESVVANASGHMYVREGNGSPLDHRFVRTLTNRNSPVIVLETPCTTPERFAGGYCGPFLEATNRLLFPELSSDGEASYGESIQDRYDSEEDFRPSTAITSPRSQLSQLSPKYGIKGTDWSPVPINADVGRRLRNATSNCSTGAFSPSHEGHGLLLEVIGGLDPADYARDASQRAPPTVVSDAGIQHYKGQTRVSNDTASITSAPHKSLEVRLFDARQLPRHPQTEPWTQDRGFIPKKQLDDIITEESVFRELKPHFSYRFTDEQIREHARYICRDTQFVLGDGRIKLKSYKPVFALLVWFRRSSNILEFLAEDVSDIDLPLINITDSHDGSHRIGRRSRTSTTESGIRSPLRCFSNWGRIESESFLRYQWTMLSPFFRESDYNDVQHYELQDNHILPWVDDTKEEYLEQQGGFGTVFPVRIHEEHHNFGDPEACRRGFAIKQLFHKNPIKFEREVGILQKFVGHNAHPHIVSLLATYKHCGKYHMIFYRAQGDLLSYWKKVNPKPSFNLETIMWVAKQCEGIAHGLVRLHRHFTILKSEEDDGDNDLVSPVYLQRVAAQGRKVAHVKSAVKQPIPCKGHLERNADLGKRKRAKDDSGIDPDMRKRTGQWQFGRHGDLKPENILWFEGNENSLGTLKIADFGQAELHEWHCKTQKRSEVADTMTYRSPEYHFGDSKFRQSSDIWSLGCLFLVFVAWTLGGEDLVSKFGKARSAIDTYWGVNTDTFFAIKSLGDGTDAWSVMVKPAVIEFIHELHLHPKCSAYIHELLGLIHTKMLVIEIASPNKRMACMHVHQELKKMRQKCCADSDYATAAAPWKEQENSMPEVSSPVHVRPPTAAMMEFFTNRKVQSDGNGWKEKKDIWDTKRYQCLLPRAQTS